MSSPAVSVILPVYNDRATVAAAVDSVLSQTFTNLELIIVDDASTDGSGQIAGAFAAQDGRVRVLHRYENSHTAAVPHECRNDGLRMASGLYAAYLDADNTWRLEYLERMVDALANARQAQLAVAQSCNHHPGPQMAHHIAADLRTPTEQGDDWVVYGLDQVRPEELGRTQYIDTNEMLHRMSVFADLGERWRVRHPRATWVNRNLGGFSPWRRHNDLDLAHRIIAVHGPAAVVLVREVLVDYHYPGAARCLPFDQPRVRPAAKAIDATAL
ncbi:MAG: glycosyltransferase family 2 protein [Dermatophilaceae bacterium]